MESHLPPMVDPQLAAQTWYTGPTTTSTEDNNALPPIEDDALDGAEEVSDADSADLQLEHDMDRMDREVAAFKASMAGGSAGNGAGAEYEEYTDIDDPAGPSSQAPWPPPPTTRGRGRPRGRPRGRARGGRATTTTTHVPNANSLEAEPHRRKRRRIRPSHPEPSGDIKMRLGTASSLLLERDYEGAMAIVLEVVRINAEIYEAWMMMSNIQRELGNTGEAVMMMLMAAHLRPRDYHGWMAVAMYALDDDGGLRMRQQQQQQQMIGDGGMDPALGGGPPGMMGAILPPVSEAERSRSQALRNKNLNIAAQCYAGAIRAQPRNCLEARIGRANVALEQGNGRLAVGEYVRVLRQKPYDMQILRHMAEAAFDAAKDPARFVEMARDAYAKCVAHVMAGGAVENGEMEWSDVLLYAEMWAFLGKVQEAIGAVRSLARWLLNRRDEHFWDDVVDDDREWDEGDRRRRLVTRFDPFRYPLDRYGEGLPLDVRAKLAIYRLKLEQDEEALLHLEWLNPSNFGTLNFFSDTPFVVKDLANQLLESKKTEMALEYYKLHQTITGEAESDVLIQQGKCYLEMHDQEHAEGCFIAAIEADETNVDARYELAVMYEAAQEEEEAFILVNEAIELERNNQLRDEAADGEYVPEAEDEDAGPSSKARKSRVKAKRRLNVVKHPKRVRIRHLANALERKKYEDTVTENFKMRYHKVQNLRGKMAEGDESVQTEWMDAAGELVDDFRSFKSFYPWEQYLKFFGYGSIFQENAEHLESNKNMEAMAMRLQKQLGPGDAGDKQAVALQEHRGIPFSAWLDLFLEYALALARSGRAQEAYRVCISARDSIVYKSSDNTFLIHVAWAACAVYAADEETCVAVARYFTKTQAGDTDAYRMFSALCRVCQSPVSWYASGPSQKYILRQIKTMDRSLVPEGEVAEGVWDKHLPPAFPHRDRGGRGKEGEDGEGGAGGQGKYEALDVCLLMLYGHVLLSSTSYTFALTYFLRAHSIDPTNPLVNLSMAVAYVHYGMKRQSENRQYIIAQGLHHLFKYHDERLKSAGADADEKRTASRQEAHYNVARTYHLLGLFALAAKFYGRVLEEALGVQKSAKDEPARIEEVNGFATEAAFNLRTWALINGDYVSAKALTARWLVI